MTDETSGNMAFRELEDQNQKVARAFRRFRRRARPLAHADIISLGYLGDLSLENFRSAQRKSELPHAPRRFLSLLLEYCTCLAILPLVLAAVVFIMYVNPSVIRLLAQHWKAILLPAGGICLGAGIVLLASRLGSAPLRSVGPPREDSDDPLLELRNLAERTVSRLRAAYRFQLSVIVVVGIIFAGLIIWSIVMVSQKQILYASVFGSVGLVMVILTQWKWQPFDRINQARRLADNADTLATGLRLRMKTISEIPDPREREIAQWKAVVQYIDRS